MVAVTTAPSVNGRFPTTLLKKLFFQSKRHDMVSKLTASAFGHRSWHAFAALTNARLLAFYAILFRCHENCPFPPARGITVGQIGPIDVNRASYRRRYPPRLRDPICSIMQRAWHAASSIADEVFNGSQHVQTSRYRPRPNCPAIAPGGRRSEIWAKMKSTLYIVFDVSL
jgi:hypothetical protein